MPVSKHEVMVMFEDVAKKATRKHGIDILSRDWEIGFSRTTRAIGDCDYGKKLIRISTEFMKVNEYDQIKKTVIHEVAHAIAGYKGDYGHGRIWKSVDRSLGGDGVRIDSVANSPKGRWILINTTNNKVVASYHRRPRSDFKNAWVQGQKKETEGKLMLVTAEQYERIVK